MVLLSTCKLTTLSGLSGENDICANFHSAESICPSVPAMGTFSGVSVFKTICIGDTVPSEFNTKVSPADTLPLDTDWTVNDSILVSTSDDVS